MGLDSLNGYYLSQGEQMELMELVKDTLLYVGRYLEWEPVDWEEGGRLDRGSKYFS